MNKFFLILFSAIILVSFGCGTVPCKNCTFEEKEFPVFENTPFSDVDSALYRVSIDIYTMYFSGLLAVKKFGDGVFRLSLISETGFKLFDMEITNGTAKIINVFSELDKEEVIRTFIEDFEMMMFGKIPRNPCDRYQHSKSGDIEYICSEEENIDTHFLIDSKTGLVRKQWKTAKAKHNYFEINYEYGDNNSLTPVFVAIIHSNVKLKMNFSLLEMDNVQK